MIDRGVPTQRVVASLSYLELEDDIVLITRCRQDAAGRTANDILELVQEILKEN